MGLAGRVTTQTATTIATGRFNVRDVLTIRVDAERTPLVTKAAELLARGVTERTGIGPVTVSDGTADVVLGVASGIGTDGFRIDGSPAGEVSVTGNEPRGLLYGVGKFLRGAELAPGTFSPGAWRGASVPEKEVRGIYFATHFHNWYHEAPVADIVRYVEELALWGCNALSVWFDMHHFSGIDDPAAQSMLDRLRAILRAANEVGIGGALTSLANEGYAGSPEALRADWTAGHDGYFRPPGGHYRVEICPSKPGGLDLILKWREEMLEAFSDLDIKHVWIWPYDQGGCTCSDCAPWGANGFLKTAEPVSRLVKRKMPGAETILSTWYFDRFIEGEWAAFDQRIRADRPDWIDYLLVDDFGGFPRYPLEHGVPGSLPAVGFAEISMEGMSPWGGFGANPRPGHWQSYWDACRHLLNGGFPYSEGIYEDINKVITLQLGWSPDRPTRDIVREYAGGCFAWDVADDLVRAVDMMEQDHGVGAQLTEDGWHYQAGELPRAEECFDLVDHVDGRLPNGVRQSWRWRVLWLRAALDAELKRNGPRPTDVTDACFDELTELYHAHNAERPVCPPANAAAQRLRGR